MRLRFRTTLALLVLLAVPCPGCFRERDCTFLPNSASAVPVIPDGLGVNIHFTDPQPGEIKMLAESGVRWVRMDFKWDLTEPARGIYDFAPYDRLMSALEPFGLRALFILDYGNPFYDDGAPPRTEGTRQAFARWAVAAAKHFAGRGIIWETYNEPNNEAFWRPRPSVNEYAALALAVGRAFRTAVPDEKLVGPAIGEMDFPFLEGCFKAGLLEYWSAVSVHPYLRSDPELVASDYCRLRQMIKTYAPFSTRSGNDGVKDIPIFSSEWGYSSVWHGMSEEKQGALLARKFLTNVANGIPVSIWYDWHDDGPDPNEAEHHFGLVRNAYQSGRDPVYQPKPAYLAAKALNNYFNGYKFDQRLAVGRDDDYVLVFAKPGDRRIAAWTTSATPHRVVIPISEGQFTVTRHTGEPAGSLSSGAQGLSINISSAPLYLSRQ